MTLENRIKRLEQASGDGDEFHFILVADDPMTYEASDGKRYGHAALVAKLTSIGRWENEPIDVTWSDWDTPLVEQARPDVLYITWEIACA